MVLLDPGGPWPGLGSRTSDDDDGLPSADEDEGPARPASRSSLYAGAAAAQLAELALGEPVGPVGLGLLPHHFSPNTLRARSWIPPDVFRPVVFLAVKPGKPVDFRRLLNAPRGDWMSGSVSSVSSPAGVRWRESVVPRLAMNEDECLCAGRVVDRRLLNAGDAGSDVLRSSSSSQISACSAHRDEPALVERAMELCLRGAEAAGVISGDRGGPNVW